MYFWRTRFICHWHNVCESTIVLALLQVISLNVYFQNMMYLPTAKGISWYGIFGVAIACGMAVTRDTFLWLLSAIPNSVESTK